MVSKTFFASEKNEPGLKYSIYDIAQWHEQAFPLATIVDQKRKLEEEKREWNESHDLLELADMYVVACGMTRFPTLDAQIAFHIINEECLLNGIKSKTLLNAINTKMAINKSRQWKRLASGTYKHIS